MQSENLDNKIKQAAEQHHPEYDGKAWPKMEKLLNRHLPQKKDRRNRAIIILFAFLLLGGGTWVLLSKPWQPNEHILTTKQDGDNPGPAKSTTPVVTPTETTGSSKSSEQTDKEVKTPVVADDVQSKENQTSEVIKNEKSVAGTKSIPENDRDNSRSNTQKTNLTGTERTVRVSTRNKTAKSNKRSGNMTNDNDNKNNRSITGNDNKIVTPGNSVTKPEGKIASNENKIVNPDVKSVTDGNKPKVVESTPANNDATVNNTKAIEKIDASKEPENKKADATVSGNKNKEKKGSSSNKKNSFFFSVSAAPDLSWVGSEGPGKVKLLTGAGAGVTIKERFTIRAGFYTGRKIYSAKWGDYKPDINPPNPQFIEKIEADCKVYEIPVSLSYNFAHAKKHNLFAGAGLSSLIMKKEKYVYDYKYPNGSGYSYTKNIHDEYKHYFSVLTLSAGYQQKLNRSLSLSVEPYAKLPLGGVGYGKVKLASAGVMFSLNFAPFSPTAKK